MARKVVGENIETINEGISNLNETETRTEDAFIELEDAIIDFYDNNTKAKTFKSKADIRNKEIKTLMLDSVRETYEFEGYKAKCSKLESCTFNQDTLLAIIKDLDRKDLIKTQEYVDLEELERCLYRKEFDAALLQPAQQISEQVRLTVTYKAKKG